MKLADVAFAIPVVIGGKTDLEYAALNGRATG